MKTQLNKFQKCRKLQEINFLSHSKLGVLKTSVLSEQLQEENHPVLSNPRNLKVLEILKIFEENFQSPRFRR